MGEVADSIIARMIDDLIVGDPWEDDGLPKGLQDFAEEKVDEVKNDTKAQNLNKGTIQW